MQAGFWDVMKEFFLWLPKRIWELLLEGFAAVINAIPVPDFLQNIGSYFGGIPPGVVYFIEPMQFEVGLAFIVTAYVVRFCIRRIPLVG